MLAPIRHAGILARVMSLASVIPAALVLALYAALALFEAARLSAGDTRTLIATGVLLAVFALGLVMRQLWAFVFALLFMVVSATAYGAASAYLGYEALTGRGGGGSGWEGLRTVVIVVAAVAAALASLFSLGLAAPLLIAWRKVGEGRSPGAWVASAAVALAGVCLIAWTVAYDYTYKRMPARSACFAGNGMQCYSLAADRDRVSVNERRDFARRGCEASYEGACRQLAELMAPASGLESPETRTLATQCSLGRAAQCLDLGTYLLKSGDAVNAAQYFEKACEASAERCVTAARVARDRGHTDLWRSLVVRGCDLEEPGSCRALFQEAAPGLDPAARLRLEMKVCLIGDVNDCMPLVRRDLRSACPVICEGDTELRFQSCRFCADEAERQGDPVLARGWRETNCAKGDRWSCEKATP